MSSMFGSLFSFPRSLFSAAKPRVVSQRCNSTYSLAHERKQRGLETRIASKRKFQKQVAIQAKVQALEKSQNRDWKAGDVYSPHDLSPAEMRKWWKRQSPSTDTFDALTLNPLDQYKNFSIMSEYMTEQGRIRHSSETGLRPVNQRKIAKAIRRSIALGLMPSVHKHPEILAAAARQRMQRGFEP